MREKCAFLILRYCRVEQMAARRAHAPKVAGSSPAPAPSPFFREGDTLRADFPLWLPPRKRGATRRRSPKATGMAAERRYAGSRPLPANMEPRAVRMQPPNRYAGMEIAGSSPAGSTMPTYTNGKCPVLKTERPERVWGFEPSYWRQMETFALGSCRDYSESSAE